MNKKRYLPIYNQNLQSAKGENQESLWAENAKENIACAKAMEVLCGYLGKEKTMDEMEIAALVEVFGLQRVTYVTVSNLLFQHPEGENLDWAESFYVALRKEDVEHFSLSMDSGYLNGFADNLREYTKHHSNLFAIEHCDELDKDMDFNGKILVVNPKELSNHFKYPEHQMELISEAFLEKDGVFRFYTRSLEDDAEATRFPSEILGVLKEENIPTWAKERSKEMMMERNTVEELFR